MSWMASRSVNWPRLVNKCQLVKINEGDNNPQTAEQTGGTLRLDWDISNTLTLTSITGFDTAEDRIQRHGRARLA